MNQKINTIILNRQKNPKLNNINILGKTIDGLIKQYILEIIDNMGCEGCAVLNADGITNSQIPEEGLILFINGNLPFVQLQTVETLLSTHVKDGNEATALANGGKAGIYCFNAYCFQKFLPEESYIPDAAEIFSKMQSAGYKTRELFTTNCGEAELTSIESNRQIYIAYSCLQKIINDRLMDAGVIMPDPKSVFIDADVQVGEDTIIYPNVFIENGSVIGSGCTIGPNSKITKMTIGDGTVFQYSVGSESAIGANCTFGPFAYIRLHCVLGDNVKVGDFVEIKNATIGDGTKMSHLTYVGDADVGKNINFGCGTITVNYDGKNKFRTVVNDGAFIGCNTNLISPVKVGSGAYIAAGSTITDDVPDETLAIARARQVIKVEWKDKRKV